MSIDIGMAPAGLSPIGLKHWVIFSYTERRGAHSQWQPRVLWVSPGSLKALKEELKIKGTPNPSQLLKVFDERDTAGFLQEAARYGLHGNAFEMIEHLGKMRRLEGEK